MRSRIFSSRLLSRGNGARGSSSLRTRAIATESASRTTASALLTRSESESPRYVVKSPFPDVSMPYTPLTPNVFSETHKWSHKTAIECGITGRNYTYGQMLDAVMKFGGTLQRLCGSRDVASDDANTTVAILSPNCPEYPIMFFGSIAVGATASPINPTYTPVEVATHLADSEAAVLVVDEAMEPLADAAIKHLQRDIHVFVNGNSKSGRPNLREIISDPKSSFAHLVDLPEDRVACLPYSSGTTGKPKGVSLPHLCFSNFKAMYYKTPQILTTNKAEGDHQEVFMGLLPFFHIYGMVAIMASGLISGAKIITLPKFDPKSYVGLLREHKISCLHLVPMLLQFIAGSPMVSPADLETIHSVMCAAAPVPPTAASLLMDKASNPIFFQEGYGLTETICNNLTTKDQDKLGSCGKLLPNVRAKVVELESGNTQPPGAPGELYIHTPAIMAGYHNNLEATQETIDEDGWFRTGDVVIYDEEGSFTIIDRIKELIKVKGLQVSPSELEDVLLSHPCVSDVGVVGVEDNLAGEVPLAYIVPSRAVSQQEIHAFMESHVAPHKQLAGGIRFVEQLPRNATGKLLRKELKKMEKQE